jgi:hypothetical protein
MIATAAVLSFEPSVHEYRLPDGRLVPSVTQILQATGVSVDFEAIGAISSRLSDQIDRRRQLGTAVHLDAHAFDDDDLEWDRVDPQVAPYLRAWATFRENTGLRPLTRERIVFHPVAFYCGTLDGLFRAPNGRQVLVDIKIGDPEASGCRYQTAGYEAAYRLEHPQDAIDERWGVQLVPDRAIPYRITPYTDWRDFGAFQAFATTYHHQADRRRSA